MKAKLTQCFYNEASEPQLEKKSVEGIPYEEGKNLPASIAEDVGSFSLHPTYSKKQLRRIHRMKMNAIQKRTGLHTRIGMLEEQN